MKSTIPNILTLANLAAGLLAIIAIFENQFLISAYLVGASLLFDFADGLVARALKVHSELGKQLDSLADTVSFGVVPGLFLYQLFQMAPSDGEPIPAFLPYLALLVPLFSALRLGKFNIDERQSENFIGLPTPANTILIYSLGLWAIFTENPTTEAILFHPFLLTVLCIGSSILLVAELPLMSLKVKDLSWKNNKGRYLLIAISILLIGILRVRAFAFIIPLYLLLSLLFKPNKY